MKDFLTGVIGKKVDIVCLGGVAVRGEVVSLSGDILQMKDDHDCECYIAIDKITVVWDAKDHPHRAGFINSIGEKS